MTAQEDVSHMMTFDVEEYFHVEAAHVPQSQWNDYASRVEDRVDRILALLEKHRTRATFFVLGWVAERQKRLVRRIADADHEIASHGMSHQMITRLAPEAFRREASESRKLLEDISGHGVLGFRAPTFSITHRTAWALDVLRETGYRYDSSVFPVRHDRYGVPEAPTTQHNAVTPAGRKIVEFPPLTLRLIKVNAPVGGGGYLRLFPFFVVNHALQVAQRNGTSAVLYMHPWELDPDQPVLPMSRLSRWRHRVNLRGAEHKLETLLQRYRFGCIADRLAETNPQKLPRFSYGPSSARSSSSWEKSNRTGALK